MATCVTCKTFETVDYPGLDTRRCFGCQTIQNGPQQQKHPRAQVMTLRRMAQRALSQHTTGGDKRAAAATAEMQYLNVEHDLGY
jgi:hypothetical protein